MVNRRRARGFITKKDRRTGKNRHIPITPRLRRKLGRIPYGESRRKANLTVKQERESGRRMRLIETNRKHELYAPYMSLLPNQMPRVSRAAAVPTERPPGERLPRERPKKAKLVVVADNSGVPLYEKRAKVEPGAKTESEVFEENQRKNREIAEKAMNAVMAEATPGRIPSEGRTGPNGEIIPMGESARKEEKRRELMGIEKTSPIDNSDINKLTYTQLVMRQERIHDRINDLESADAQKYAEHHDIMTAEGFREYEERLKAGKNGPHAKEIERLKGEFESVQKRAEKLKVEWDRAQEQSAEEFDRLIASHRGRRKAEREGGESD